MAKFNLKSDYKPMGDQPTAIAQLTENLQKGVREQVLLGVTGSGKSVVGATKVFLQHGDKNYHLPISTLDNIFSSPLRGKQNVTQVANIESKAALTIAWQPESGKVGCAPITEVSRHLYKGLIFNIETSCGRTNAFTDSHNVYVMREGKLQLLPSNKLKEGDWLPLPETLSLSVGNGVEAVDLRDWLTEDAFYVNIAGYQKLDLATLKVITNTRKAWAVSTGRERLGFTAYKQLTREYRQVREDRISTIKRAASIPVIIPATNEFWRFLGLYIAEGHSTGRYVVLSTGDESIAQEFAAGSSCFGLLLKKRLKQYDYQISSKVLARLMQTWCGSNARAKHLPSFWPQASNKQLGLLLGSIFAGDGWVEANAICLASASKELVSDIQCALLRFGIHGRVKPKKVRYNGGMNLSWTLSIYGSMELRKFHEQIGFGLARKDEKLSSLLKKKLKTNTNVDIFPWSGEYIEKFCRKYGLYQRDLAKVAGVSRSLISLYLSGVRLPARHRVRDILLFLLNIAQSQNDIKEVERLNWQIALSKLYWSPVKNISKNSVESEVVYDLSVPEHNTFLAGGGYFVHNTFTMANVIQNTQKPTLVLSHNKTLAAQLYGEFKNFFPNNAVHYFVSYFDYYQPEAYIPRSDTYIEKDSQINEEIDRLRHAATDSLLTRRDVIIVASVSCIYGIGSVEDYEGLSIEIKVGERRVRDKFLRQLTDIQYARNDIDFHRSTFRVRGDVVDVFPAGEEVAYRLEFFGDEVDRITKIDPLTGEILANIEVLRIFPGSHFVTPQEKLKVALGEIEHELDERLGYFKKNGQLLEAQRLEQRTRFDLEMMEETGFVKGIENYSRYLTNREPGEQPATLLDYFPDDFMMFVDESHMTIPQVRGMYNGDRARKEVLVDYGFRLPSALDNRPLTFTEFEKHVNKVIYVSATPADYELSRSSKPAEQVIRPTGLIDPIIEVRPIEGQIDDLIVEIKATVDKRQRILVTTLTKRMAEDLTEYLQELKVKVTYLHSDVDTLDRTDILRDLRLGTYDVVVGINLLREGLDLPEVSLVAILDADKEGFLRSEQALIQTVGRAARHVEGRVLMYADKITGSMQRTIDETNRRREIQEEYNKKHGITPAGISKAIEKGMRPDLPEEAKKAKLDLKKIPKDEYGYLIKDLNAQMELASANLEFEKAAELRDIITNIKSKL